MNESHAQANNRTYIGTWLALLSLTVGMLATGYISLSRGLLILVLLVAMMAKASLIGAYFMHLKFERKGLIVGVAVALLGTAAFLFVLLALDSYSISTMLAD